MPERPLRHGCRMGRLPQEPELSGKLWLTRVSAPAETFEYSGGHAEDRILFIAT
jgi:hypothetical protein